MLLLIFILILSCIIQNLLKLFLKSRCEHHISSFQPMEPPLSYWHQFCTVFRVIARSTPSFILTRSFTVFQFHPQSVVWNTEEVLLLLCFLFYSYNFKISLSRQKSHFLDCGYEKQVIVIKQTFLKSTGFGKREIFKLHVDFNYFLYIVLLLQ